MQSSDPDGCLWGCGLTMAAMPVFMLIQHLDERNKRKAERLEEETNVLRLA